MDKDTSLPNVDLTPEMVEKLKDTNIDHEKFALWVTHTLAMKYGKDCNPQELMENKRVQFRSIIDPKSWYEIVGLYVRWRIEPLSQLPLFFFLSKNDSNNTEDNSISSILSEQGWVWSEQLGWLQQDIPTSETSNG